MRSHVVFIIARASVCSEAFVRMGTEWRVLLLCAVCGFWSLGGADMFVRRLVLLQCNSLLYIYISSQFRDGRIIVIIIIIICLSVCLFVCLTLWVCVWKFVCNGNHSKASLCLYLCLCLSVSLSLSVCLCLSVCLSPFPLCLSQAMVLYGSSYVPCTRFHVNK